MSRFAAAVALLLVCAAAAPAQDLSRCVPARWPWADPALLRLLDGSPLNCLLIEGAAGKPELLQAARQRGVRVLAVLGSGPLADTASVDGYVTEAGTAAPAGLAKPLIRLLSRPALDLDSGEGVAGTTEGLWPGIRAEKGGAAHSGPTGAPWIETNAGYLRYVRATLPAGAALWMANRPPEGTAWGAQRYAKAAADAAVNGARWVVALDSGFAALLASGDARALAGWRRFNQLLAFYETHRELCEAPDYSQLAVLQDPGSGALVSGSVLDMIAAKHIPLLVVPAPRFLERRLEGVRLLLNIDPASLSPEQAERVREVARRGATVVNGPAGWKLSLPPEGELTFPEAEVKRLDEIWREINGLIGRRNFALRVFGAPGMLSNLKALPEGRLAIHLVNYTDYPVDSITLHLTGKFRAARLLTPEGEKKAELYAMEEGTGVDIARIDSVGVVVLEP